MGMLSEVEVARIDALAERMVPENFEQYTRKQLVEHAFEVLSTTESLDRRDLLTMLAATVVNEWGVVDCWKDHAEHMGMHGDPTMPKNWRRFVPELEAVERAAGEEYRGKIG